MIRPATASSAPAAYPRSRGEHVVDVLLNDSTNGSSPLMRGTFVSQTPRHRNARLIPARAGNTLGTCHPRGSGAAHPRSRGEHVEPSSTRLVVCGSSPLSQGTFVHVLHLIVPLRLIPRSRGEHALVSESMNSPHGSSPLARGAHTESAGVHLCLRLIPTHAGNIGTPQLRNGGRSAHPRSRGEHASAEPNTLSHCGSSPLARGTSSLK